MDEKKKRTPRVKGGSKRNPGNQGKSLQISPREMLLCIRERFFSALAIAVVICALIGGWLLSQPKVYQTQSRILFDRKERVVDMREVMDQSIHGGRNDAMFATYLDQITGSSMAEKVVRSLSNEEKLSVWRPYATPGMAVPARLDAAVKGIVMRSANAFRQGSTLFILIQVRHRNPQVAAMLADRFASQFIVFLVERNTSVNNSAIAFLREQSDELRRKADASDVELQKYRESTGMVSLDESRNIVVDRMKTLSSTVTSSQVARLAIEARLQQAEAILAGSGDPLELATTAEFSNLANVQNQIDNLNTQRAIMAERYGVRHPAMVDNQRSLQALTALRGELVLTAMANLRNQQSKAMHEEAQLKAELAIAEQESLRLDQMAIKFNVLRREAETNRSTYGQLLNRLNETTVTARLDSSNIRIADQAFVPTRPVEPDAGKIMMMLVVLGLGIMVCYPIALELMFNRIRGWADVETYLELPLLGEVPVFKKMSAKILPHLVTRSDDEEAQESIRALYSQLKLTSKIDVPKIILITSTLPSEGKSFVASNLAAAFAAHGVKTLLVDTDLRRPTQHRSFDLPNDVGLLSWLEKKLAVSDQTLADPDLGIHECAPNFHLLRTGGSTRRSTEILDSNLIKELLLTLKKQFDVVIVDTPPAGVFPDALTLSEHADELIYVVRHNHVSRPAVRRINERIAATGISQAGVILNMMPTGRRTGAYYSSYGHYGSKYYEGYKKEDKA